MSKYVIVKELNSGEANAWYSSCSRDKKPFIRVVKRGKYAKVDFDYISLPSKYDAIVRDKGPEFLSIFRKHADKKSEYQGGGAAWLFTKIPVDNAEKLAEELYDYTESLLTE